MSELGAGSGTSYPTGIDTDNTIEVNSPSTNKTKARAEVPNDLAAAIVAIETELGTSPSGTAADVKTFLQVQHNTTGTHKNITTDTLSASGQITSTVAVGTAPLVVTSTTKVDNLNADLLDGFHASQVPINGQIIALDSNGHLNMTSSAASNIALSKDAALTIRDSANTHDSNIATMTSDIIYYGDAAYAAHIDSLGAIAGTIANATTATKLTDGTNSINTKIINIGDWNMDSAASVSVAHGLTFAKIRNISALILKDDSTAILDLVGAGAGSCTATSTNISLIRVTSGTFDSTDYDATSFNRGYITITYVD
jgi:hypothetical protein